MMNLTIIIMLMVNLMHHLKGIIIIEDMTIVMVMVTKNIPKRANFADDDYDPADDFVNEYEQDDDGDEDDLGHYDNIYLNIGKMPD